MSMFKDAVKRHAARKAGKAASTKDGRPGDSAVHAPSAHVPATFRSLYSSRDGALFLYEDAQGHLTAVDASKLA